MKARPVPGGYLFIIAGVSMRFRPSGTGQMLVQAVGGSNIGAAKAQGSSAAARRGSEGRRGGGQIQARQPGAMGDALERIETGKGVAKVVTFNR